MDKRVLVINPGSTSTKLALFCGTEKVFDKTLRHSREDLQPFAWVMEQADFRQKAIEQALAEQQVDLNGLDAVCARGGQLPYCAAGTYQVDQDMVDFMYTVRDAAHASNLGCVLALRIARPLGLYLRPGHSGRDDRRGADVRFAGAAPDDDGTCAELPRHGHALRQRGAAQAAG